MTQPPPPKGRVPRWLLITLGVTPLVALFALLIAGLIRSNPNPGNLATYNSSGEATVLRDTPSDFTLTLFDGGTVRLSELRGKVVMLDFWGSWCVPCRQEAPEVQRTWTKYRDKGVVFVGINVFDNAGDARKFLDEYGISYPTGPDPKGAIAIEYGLTGVPEKFFITRDGRIAHKYVGPMTEAALSGILDKLLASA